MSHVEVFFFIKVRLLTVEKKLRNRIKQIRILRPKKQELEQDLTKRKLCQSQRGEKFYEKYDISKDRI